ncbi:MAG: prepilin-type N-terminal cleavage/methylation domain-containing protein [Fimbriimonadaceae bacterium]
MKHRGFTLIELLVVIAIIAILAAILFPVFAQAKAQAKKISSLSNDKQTALAVLMYSNDVDDYFPVGSGCGWFYPLDGGWAWDTQPYIKNLPLLRDPSDPLLTAWWQSWFTPGVAVEISYASNGFQAWDNAAAKWDLYGVMGMNQGPQTVSSRCSAGAQWMGTMTTVTTAVTKPSETVMIAGRFSGNNQFGQGDMLSGVNWWDWTSPGELPDGSLAANTPLVVSGVTVNQDQRNGAIATVYAGQGIFTFTDGHAKTMSPIQTDPNSVTLPQNNMWNARR